MPKRMCVIGSFNIDIVTTVNQFPEIGETVRTNTFDILIGGGKGANQAVALGRLGADVMMVGKLGDKFYGPDYIKVLQKNHVSCAGVMIEKDQYPGIAIVAVDARSDNILLIHAGTNAMVDISYIREKWDMIADCDIFLLQLEIPFETNYYLMQELKKLNKLIIFDPAPASAIPDDYYRCSAYVTPNETELQALSGLTVRTKDDFFRAGQVLLDKGAQTVIAKAGKSGAYIISREQFIHVPGFEVKAIDPTAAGDTFNAGFAFAISLGSGLYESVVFANAAAALSTMAIGAQNAMPDVESVNQFIKKHKADQDKKL